MPLASQVLDACRARGWRIATAESCTGGMIAAALTDVAGSSDVFERGFVTYSNLAKMDMLSVKAAALSEFGAVSETVAQQMAMGAIDHSNADIGVSVTGIAGPGGSDHKPEGRVCFGLAVMGRDVVVETVEFGTLGRENVRAAACQHALGMILGAVP